jgi:hypothetical protein
MDKVETYKVATGDMIMVSGELAVIAKIETYDDKYLELSLMKDVPNGSVLYKILILGNKDHYISKRHDPATHGYKIVHNIVGENSHGELDFETIVYRENI